MLKTRGILLFALGHPQYGRMAFTLAATIKAAQKDAQIAVVYEGVALNHIGDHQKFVFDYLIPADANIPINPGCKLHAPKYTPFENTVILDVDTLWLPRKKPDELFDELEGVSFTSITEGKEGDQGLYYFWCDPGEARQQYSLQIPMYQWRTEIIYFNKDGARILDRAREISDTHTLKSMLKFADAVPDEMAINIASAEMGIHPHVYKWKPSFWYMLNGNAIPNPHELYEKYYIISVGSNRVSNTMRKYYDTLASAACRELGMNHCFSLQEKRTYLPVTRAKM